MKFRNAEWGGSRGRQSLEAVDPSERVVGERLARREKFSASSGARIDAMVSIGIDENTP
jgi:hypothetical protein